MTLLTRYFILFFTCTTFVFTSLASNASEIFELADKKFNQHQYDEAKIHLKNLLKDQPNNIPARFLMVELLLAVEQAALAQTELNIIEGLGGDYKKITLLRSKTLLMQNKYNEILSIFEDNYIDQIYAAKMYVLKGLAHLGLRQLLLSEEAFNQALSLNVSNLDAILGLAQLKVNRFQYEEANTLVEQVLATPFPPEKAWFLKATVEQNLGNYDKALVNINRVLLENSEDVNALILRATLLFELQNYSTANKDALQILNKVPNEPRAKFIQAAIAVKDNDEESSKQLIEEIAQTLSKISKEDLRSSPSYLYLAGVIFYQQNQYELAKEYFNQYLEIDDFNVSAKILLAQISMRQGDFEGAKSQLVKANIQHGDKGQILTLLGVCYLELQQYESALAYFKQVKSIQPTASVDLQLAKAYLSLKQTATAIQLLTEGDFTGEQQVLAGLLLVKSYLQAGKAEQAIKVAKNLSLLQPENPEFHHHLGFVYQSVGSFEQAKLQFQKALKLNHLHVKSIISLAQVTSTMGQPDKGLLQLQSALVQLPNDIDILKALANHFERMGEDSNATLTYEKALKQDPSSEVLMINYASSLAKQGAYDDAIEAIKAFILSHEKTDKIYLLLGHLYLNTKQVQLAIESYRDALKFDGNKSQVYFYIAKANQRVRRFSDTVAAYQKSIAWAPTSLGPMLALASYLNQESRYNEAIVVLLAFDGGAKTSDRFYSVLAHTYFLNKEYEKAKDTYLKIKQSQQISTISGLALVYQAINQQKKAIALIESALSTDTNNLLLLSTLAEIYMKNKQWLKAEEIYVQILKLDEDQPMWLNNAAYIAMSQLKFGKAKEFATRSLALVDDAPDSLDTLGWIYYLTNEYVQALPLLRKALAIDSSNVEIKYHMALTLKALGQDKEAFNLLREVVNSQNDFTDKNQALETLELWGKS
ncbi:PEP-CTERM system TPR-repeat protein PrsT [Colwellia sp. BRX10-3]|uniref:XrtA/PEP-CTERM system TPR-repeat protein PrsT n=1 Tax=Colwellia sp. BRX10-3 TaxID=2759844 RepID=UPI0015F4052F|nr:XrtA/PEP-CTERM system TPR-repeat protein PrsT [Colwellia sp. BRX10-3]MBA6390698.1 PEP-CTERM system TPR-repeat protein PrsT [Colwellia sp. BRX10-3]